ncbi:hypothetical protein EV359DRAFT_87174 [Lentinula novae-zelandiae]|nr:hypothetical protein EV359DRAFT_87174 [Lentinula novae-zelandiae]
MSNRTVPLRRSTSLLQDPSDRKPPTINDLRVKECYICRDEERYDDPAANRRDWMHPCKCKLIAHQSCLKSFIQSSLAFLSSSLFFRIGNTILQAMGMSFLATSAVGPATFTAVSVFTAGTGYGAIAVREYFAPGRAN